MAKPSPAAPSRWTRDETASALLDALRTARGAKRRETPEARARREARQAEWDAMRAREEVLLAELRNGGAK